MSSIAKVKEYLARFGAAGRVTELDHSSATVELAAQALGVEGARIAKSLSFHMGEGCMIIVMAGDVLMSCLCARLSALTGPLPYSMARSTMAFKP